MTRVCAPCHASIWWLDPTATIRSPSTATASAVGRLLSTVPILALRMTRSAAGGDCASWDWTQSERSMISANERRKAARANERVVFIFRLSPDYRIQVSSRVTLTLLCQAPTLRSHCAGATTRVCSNFETKHSLASLSWLEPPTGTPLFCIAGQGWQTQTHERRDNNSRLAASPCQGPDRRRSRSHADGNSESSSVPVGLERLRGGKQWTGSRRKSASVSA